MKRGDYQMRMSDIIENFLNEMFRDSQQEIEIQRNELANHFNCVPSQINYVIQTRFTPERGYIVESRRGGGGSIKIKRVHITKSNYMMHIINSIGDKLTQMDANQIIRNFYENDYLTEREAKIILSVMSDKVLPNVNRDETRAILLKNILINLV